MAVSAVKLHHFAMHKASATVDAGRDLAAVGGAIRVMRKLRELSQEELADFAGLDRSHMGRIERGERNVSLLNLLRIARGLDCKLSELFEKSGL